MKITKRLLALLLALCLTFGNVMPAMATELAADETNTAANEVEKEIQETTESVVSGMTGVEESPFAAETTEVTEEPTAAPTEEPAAPSTPAEIVAAAYALAEGESLEGTYTLTGTIIGITEAYNATYGNITVTIAVEGCEDKPIVCFRMKGDGADQLAKNDVITVTGTLKNYYGTIEFDAGCSLDSYVKGEPEEEVAGTTYTFSSYTAGVQYALNEEHVLDDVVTVITNQAHFTTQIRLYDSSSYDGTAVIKSTKYIDTIVLNAGNKAATLNVYGSADGATWNLITGLTTTAAYLDHTVDVPDGYNYLKLDAEGGLQIRVASMTIVFGADAPVVENPEPTEPEVTEPEVTEPEVTEPEATEPAGGEETTSAVLTFANQTYRTYFDSADKAVYENNGIKFTNAMAKATNPLRDNSGDDHVRMYASSETTIEHPGMTKIVFTTKTTGYASALMTDLAGKGETSTDDAGTVVTLVLNEAADSIQIVHTAQTRFTQIEVFAKAGSGENPEPTEPEVTEPEVTEPEVTEPEVTEPSGGEETAAATINFADGASRTSYSAEQQVWQSGDLVLTNDKNTSTSDIYDHIAKGYGEIRLYAGSKVTVAYPGMTKVVFTCDDYKENYVTYLQSSVSAFGTVTVDGTVVTLELTEAVNSFTYLAAGQHRLTEIAVYGTGVAVEEEEFVRPETPAEIVAAAYALAEGAMLKEGPYTLTGVITEIDEEGYNAQYENITVTITVEGCEDYPIVCFRMKGTGADTLKLQDTITVTGDLTNYNGTIEFGSGCSLDEVIPYVPAGSVDNPEQVTFTPNGDGTSTATVTVPANTTYYISFTTGMGYMSSDMVLTVDGVEYGIYNGNFFQPAVVALTNETDGEWTFTLVLSYPLGSQMNPDTMNVFIEGESWDDSEGENEIWVDADNWNGYMYTWTAPAAGELTVTMENGKSGWAYSVYNMTSYASTEIHYSSDVPPVNAETITVEAGDQIQVMVNTCGATSDVLPGGVVYFTAYFEKFVGTQANPLDPEWIWNETWTEATATVTVPANTPVYYIRSFGIGGMLLSIDGGEPVLLEGNPRMPVEFTLTNDTDAEKVFTLTLTQAPAEVGSWSNPAELVIGENTATLAEGAQGYYYAYTATERGTLTITVSGDSWTYSGGNTTTGIYCDTHWHNDDPVVATETFEVNKGDVVEIMVNTYDPQNEWYAPAGTVTVAAEFAAGEGTQSNPHALWIQSNDQWYSLSVPAGETVYYNVSGAGGMILEAWADAGMVMTVDGVEYTYEAWGGQETTIPGSAWNRMPASISFTNTAEYEGWVNFGFYYPMGSTISPAHLTIGKNSVKLEANDTDGYNYAFQAPTSGYLTITMTSKSNWVYCINYETWEFPADSDPYQTTKYGDIHYSTDTAVVKSETIYLSAGDTAYLNVGTEDWGAGTISFTAAFASKEVDMLAGKSATLSFTDPATGKAVAANKANWSIVSMYTLTEDENGYNVPNFFPAEDLANHATIKNGKITAAAGATEPIYVNVYANLMSDENVYNNFLVVIRPAVTSIEIVPQAYHYETDKTTDVTVPAGEALQYYINGDYGYRMTAVTAPGTALSDVTWKSSNPKILTVNEYGWINPAFNTKTGKPATGTVTLTATAKDGSGVKATIKVTSSWLVDWVDVSPKNDQWTVGSGKSVTMVPNVDSWATNKAVNWDVKVVEWSDETWDWNVVDMDHSTVATITDKGVLKAATALTQTYMVMVTATAQDAGAASGSCVVTVAPVASKVVIEAPAQHDIGYSNEIFVKAEAISADGLYSTTDLKLTFSNAKMVEDYYYGGSWNEETFEYEDGIFIILTGKTGKLTITATATDGSKVSAKATVNVVKGPDTVILSQNDAILAAGKSLKLKATVGSSVYDWETDTVSVDTKVTNKTVTWKAAVLEWNDEIGDWFEVECDIGLKVNNGTVSTNAKKVAAYVAEKGEYPMILVTATANMAGPYGEYAEDNCWIELREPVTKINIIQHNAVVTGKTVAMDAEAIVVLSADPIPEGATYLYTWTSSNAKVATVVENVDGSVTVKPAGKLGTAVITAKATDGSNKSARVTIKVVNKVDSLTINSDAFVLSGKTSGRSFDLNKILTVNPANASNKKVTWKIADWSQQLATDNKVTLTATGKLTVKKDVSAPVNLYVIATAKDGFGASRTAMITITPATTEVTIVNVDGAPLTGAQELTVGETLALTAVSNPAGAAGKYTWKTSNKKVATVDENGVVTGIKAGKVTITVTAADGTNKSAKITINVVNPVPAE